MRGNNYHIPKLQRLHRCSSVIYNAGIEVNIKRVPAKFAELQSWLGEHGF